MTRNRGEQTRRAIVEAGLGLATEEGLSAVTLDRVAERVGVTKQAVLYHVGTKRGLLLALLVDALGEEADALTASIRDARSAHEAVVSFLSSAVDYYLTNLVRFRAIYVAVQVSGPPIPEEDRARVIYPTTSRIYDALEDALAADPTVDPELDLRKAAVGVHFAAVGVACYAAMLEAAGETLRHDIRELTSQLAEVIGRGMVGRARRL